MTSKQTVVLVHGAYAESSSWNSVIRPLAAEGHRVVAWANPLRSVAADAAALSDLLRTVEGPVLLVGHSYGGAVVTNVAPDAGDVVGLVFVAAFALAPGESCADASALVPGSTLGETQVRVPLAGGGADTYIAPDRYHQQFCADLPHEEALLMSVTQRPITEAALGEASGDRPLWRDLPSWFLFGELDRNIPVGAHRRMAERAGARRAVEVPGASHVVGMSHHDEATRLVLEAAAATASVTA
ncbi:MULTISPECIES: alpha/beta fold hydrolase [unclassified Geodermatophilus]